MTIEDFRNFIKLAQTSPWLHHSGDDLTRSRSSQRHLDMVHSHIKIVFVFMVS